jgi:hypothetical protein
MNLAALVPPGRFFFVRWSPTRNQIDIRVIKARRGGGQLIGVTMTPTMFRFRLEILDITVRQFAAMTGVDYEEARWWGVFRSDAKAFPRWVEPTIAAWGHGGVPPRP